MGFMLSGFKEQHDFHCDQRKDYMKTKKMIQMVHHLLLKYDFRLNYTKLIKLLYLADREALNRWDASITKDSYFALAQGPVLSGLYELIREKFPDPLSQAQWSSRFYSDGYDLVSTIREELPVDELSEREIALLDEIDSKFHGWTWNQLVDYVHDHEKFPEWEDPLGTSIPISVQKILECLGRSNEQIKTILENEQFFENEEKRYPSSWGMVLGVKIHLASSCQVIMSA